MSSRGAGRFRMTVGALLCLVVVGPLTPTASGADALPPTRCTDRSAVTRVGDWEAVRSPAFTTRPGGRGQAVTAIAVHPSRPATRYATNGTSVERTDDGGCTWREVYALPDVPTEEDTLAVATSEVVELVAPLDPRAHDRLVLLLRDGNGGPRVLVSVDGGVEPFRDRSEGLPPGGTPTDLLVAATNPEFLFLGVRAVPGAQEPGGSPLPVPVPTLPPLPGLPGGPAAPVPTGGLWASVDGGLTWEARLDPDDLEGSTRAIDLLAGHPIAPNRLWAVSDGVLRASTDGGRTFRGKAPSEQEQRELDWDVTAVAADVLSTSAGDGAGRLVLLAFSRTSAQDGGPVSLLSVDEGASFDQVRAPGVVDAMAPFLPGTGSFAVSTRAGADGRPAVTLYSLRRGMLPNTITVSPPVSTPDLAVTTDRSDSPTFHARTPTSLLRYVGPAAALPPRVPPVIGGSQLDSLSPLGEAVVSPARDEVVLEVGQRVTVPHALTTPRRLTPLDLYVLLDTSESMADDLDAVRADLRALVAALRQRGLDLSVGLGEFKGGESSVAYRRVVGVGPSTRAFSAGLDTLVADGFGLEAQLIALEQALDGRGETAADLLPAECKLSVSDPDRFVTEERRTAPPVVGGQAADFRPGSVPVVLMVTDTNFLRPAGTPLKPDCSVDVESVATAYSNKDVHVVGLGVDDVDNGPRAADMTELAVATGAMQPPGQSCAPTISGRPGGPAVCRRALDLLPTLERLAGARKEVVGLDVVETTGSKVVAEVTGRIAPVDLRSQRTAPLPITYSCADVEAGDYSADVEVRLAGVTLAEVLATVRCTPPVAPLVPPVVAVVAPPIVGLLPPPAAVPPPPPPAQVVQPQVQTQPQANPQVQSGVQEDQQQQLELALALQAGPRADEQTELAMSARAPVVPAPAFLLVVTAMASGAAGLQLRRQRREREALLGRLVTAR